MLCVPCLGSFVVVRMVVNTASGTTIDDDALLYSDWSSDHCGSRKLLADDG